MLVRCRLEDNMQCKDFVYVCRSIVYGCVARLAISPETGCSSIN